MVSSGYSDVGEEWKQKLLYRQDLITRDTTIEVLLYDDSADSLTDSSDIGDVTTEPTDGNYTRQTFTLDSSDVTLTQTGGEIQAQVVVTFDVTDTTGTVDAAGAVVDFQSDVVNAEGAANPHLIYTSSVGDADLSNFTGSFEVTINALEDD
jgi:hypothetical protein